MDDRTQPSEETTMAARRVHHPGSQGGPMAQRTRGGLRIDASGWSRPLFSFLLTCHFLMQDGCSTLLAL
jgi:hypothetical protein